MSDTLIPRIAVIGCGGTISSFGTSNLDVMDYPDEGRKLAVHEVLAHVPEVGQIAQIVPVTFRDVSSTALTVEDWLRLRKVTELRSERDACEICADALVRRAVAAMDPRSFEYLGEILQRELQAAALVPRKIPFALCRDAIRAMTRNVWLIRTNDLKELPPLDGVA
jgi:hypothetical protein